MGTVIDVGVSGATAPTPRALVRTSRPMRATVGLVAALLVGSLAACEPAGGAPGAPSPGSSPIAGATETATTTGPAASTGPSSPASPAATDGAARQMAWTSVTPDTPVRPSGGFEHAFLVSDRGAVILIRNLEGAMPTLVAVSGDGSDWAVEELRSTTVPFGTSIDGGTDWLQVVDSVDGGPPTLVASADGHTWTTRGRFPAGVTNAGDNAVNGATILACGPGSGAAEQLSVCAVSKDAGATWERARALESLLGTHQVRSIAPLGVDRPDGGFVVFQEADTEGVSRALVSKDGLEWTGALATTVPSNAFRSTAFGSMAYIVGTDGTILSSPDGMQWASTPLPGTRVGAVRTLARAGDALLAIGEVSEPEGNAHATDVLVSADGVTWREDTVPAALRSVPDPMFLSIPGGVLVPGDPTMLVGRPIPWGGAEASPSAAAGGFPALACAGGQVGGAVDYGPDPTGGATDVRTGTLALLGIRPSDAVVVSGTRTGVVRDGRLVAIADWFRGADGWLISQFGACGDSGISMAS